MGTNVRDKQPKRLAWQALYAGSMKQLGQAKRQKSQSAVGSVETPTSA